MKHFLVFVAFLLIGGIGGHAVSGASTFVTVAQVVNAKSFTTSDGKTVRLASLQAPNLPDERLGEPMGGEARAALAAMIEGKQVRLKIIEAADRHGRIVADIYDERGRWVQEEMVKAGMAMVYSFADNQANLPRLLLAEREARAAKRGIWAVSYYAVVKAERAGERMGRYALVEGAVTQAVRPKDNWYINFSEDWKTDFTGFVARKDNRHFKQFDLTALKGKRVRLRGWVYEHDGPAMDITHPGQIEVVE